MCECDKCVVLAASARETTGPNLQMHTARVVQIVRCIHVENVQLSVLNEQHMHVAHLHEDTDT